MTVQELTDALQKVEDKTKEAFIVVEKGLYEERLIKDVIEGFDAVMIYDC